MKVIEPLFLNDLYAEFEKIKEDKKKLKNLYTRLKNIKIFDPACGSGNFLIISYKELCRLQMKIIEHLESFEDTFALMGRHNPINIKLSNFYGIELDDFPVEIARLSLYLAEHQIHTEYEEIFGSKIPTLPLESSGNIVKGNACRIDWHEVCPIGNEDEIYVLGNPPFKGKQDTTKKPDMALVFHDVKNHGNLDYVTCWHKKATDYIEDTRIQVAFVSTNSICQGIAVPALWNHLFAKGIIINFTYTSFQWGNSAKDNAGVYCVIIGFACFAKEKKIIFTKDTISEVENINAYLLDASNLIVSERRKPISGLSPMTVGSCPAPSKEFSLSEEERKIILLETPNVENLIHPFWGAKEFIHGIKRYCFWLKDARSDEINNNPEIQRRIENVRKLRSISTKVPTQKKASIPHRFTEERYIKAPAIFVPILSSVNYKYVPCGFIEENVIPSNLANAIYNPKTWLFSIVTSKLVMIWIDTIGGKFKGDYRYSNLVYNSFPFPEISQKQKDTLERYALDILEEREKYAGKTLAYLYNKDTMPESLLEAHRQNDLAVERCYRITPFKNDQERLEYLFKEYEKMVKAEKGQKD